MTAQLKRSYGKGFKPSLKIVEAQKMTTDDKKMTTGDEVMTLVTPFDDDGDESSYKWSEIRNRLGLSSNVANARWMPDKLMPLFSNIDGISLLTDQGKPTKVCAQMLFRYKAFVIDDGNDYEAFAKQVKTAFENSIDDSVTSVAITVLEFGDNDYESGDEPLSPNYSSSAMTVMRDRISDRNDDLESRVALALQTVQQAQQAEANYKSLSDKSWEQQVIEDEIAKVQLEADQKKREYELRAKVRQMLEAKQT